MSLFCHLLHKDQKPDVFTNSHQFHGWSTYPPPDVNKPLIRLYFWGGGTVGGGWLTSHTKCCSASSQALPGLAIEKQDLPTHMLHSVWGQFFFGNRVDSDRSVQAFEGHTSQTLHIAGMKYIRIFPWKSSRPLK